MTAFAPEQYKETLDFSRDGGRRCAALPASEDQSDSRVSLAPGYCSVPTALGALAHRISWLAPFALGNVEQIAPVAEFGVVFLLFMIGLELSWQRLAIIGRLVFGLGALQVFGSAAALGGLAFALERAANLGGRASDSPLPLSSTAIVIPVLAEAKRLGTTAGRTIFAVLLFQDLMVAPLLFMVTMLGIRGGSLGMAVVSTLVPALTGLSVIVLGGRLVMRPLFRHVAAAGSTEFFMAACLLVVIGTGFVTAMSGLSMGLGAFIAGILLAETEYRREIEVTIEPFKGLLLGLFFVSIGASLDLSQVFSAPLKTLRSCAWFHPGEVLRQLARGLDCTLTRAHLHRGRAHARAWRRICFCHHHGRRRRQGLPAAAGADVMVAVTLSMFAVPLLGVLARRLTSRPSAGTL